MRCNTFMVEVLLFSPVRNSAERREIVFQAAVFMQVCEDCSGELSRNPVVVKPRAFPGEIANTIVPYFLSTSRQAAAQFISMDFLMILNASLSEHRKELRVRDLNTSQIQLQQRIPVGVESTHGISVGSSRRWSRALQPSSRVRSFRHCL